MDNEEFLKQQYELLKKYHKKYLVQYGVKLSALFQNGKYLKNALILIKLSENYPDTKIYTKEELTTFLRKFYPQVSDMQQARHLAMQDGWYIASGTRGDAGIPKGCYKLKTLEKPYPAYCIERRKGFQGNFESIKKEYNYRCATCGSEEGKEHLFRKGVIVQIQEGHMNPAKPLQEGNIIPQCQICNRADRNRWVYDKTGRVIAVATTQDGVRIVKKFLKAANVEIQTDIFEYLKSLIKAMSQQTVDK